MQNAFRVGEMDLVAVWQLETEPHLLTYLPQPYFSIGTMLGTN